MGSLTTVRAPQYQYYVDALGVVEKEEEEEKLSIQYYRCRWVYTPGLKLESSAN